MQTNATDERRIPRPQKSLENNFTLYITHHFGDFIGIIRKKAALIIYAVILTVIVAGCGVGGAISTSSTTTGKTGDTGGAGFPDGSAGATSYSGTGSATLAWDAPGTNTDGTPLTDLAGYKIYYGTSSGNYTSAIDVGNVTNYIVTNLSSGAYYFSVVSYDISGIESDYSNEASRIIQ